MTPEDAESPPHLAVHEARLISVLDTAVDGILVINDRGEILVYNKACETLFGYAPAEAIGRNIRLLMPDDYARAHDRYVENYRATGRRKIIGIGREVHGQHKDGTIFPVELSVGEAHTTVGRQFIGIVRDLRPRKEAERRVSELQADLVHMARVSAMDEMGAALAHELNQPLTAIMLYLQAATRTLDKGDVATHMELFRQVLSKAVHEAERAGSIISRMRHFVEKREPQRKVTDLNRIVDEAVDLTLLAVKTPGRMIRLYGGSLPKALIDPVQVQQVVVNLVRNAFEAVREAENPTVTVRTGQAGDMLVIEVEDNGRGLPPEIVPNLFKAFSTSKRTGMGLGLSISRTIAQNHAGDLTVDPGGDGRGARFRVQLPVASEADVAAAASDLEAEASRRPQRSW